MAGLFDLTGKVALITGSSRGIGRAIAMQMAKAGAAVVISSRKPAPCEAVAAEIVAAGGRAISLPASIADKAQLQALVDETTRQLGKIDILVCNAAINPYYGPSAGISDDQFDKIMASNIRSNHWLCHMVLPQMVERRDGAIIIISSVAGIMGNSTIGVYGISKAADMALTRNLAVEFGPHNIRVNCIAPGLIKTDFARALWEDPNVLKIATELYPLRRIGTPDEVAGAALMFASPAGAFISGQTLVIDGGGTISQGR